MDHLLKCPMLPQECTNEHLMEYNEAATECVFQWMNNVSCHDIITTRIEKGSIFNLIVS